MTSEKIDLLVKALIKAKAKFKSFEKTKENPYFKSKYADLGAVDAATSAALHENGLIVVQPTGVLNGTPVLETILAHESGQFISGTYPLIPTKNDPQMLGSALTYARRYALSALLTVVADDDDDGNAASAPAKPSATTQQKAAPAAGVPDTVTFVPDIVSVKSGEKNGKPWTKYGIKSPSGDIYGTFDERMGNLAQDAKAGGFPVSVGYVISGQYKNVLSVVRYESDIEEVPF